MGRAAASGGGNPRDEWLRQAVAWGRLAESIDCSAPTVSAAAQGPAPDPRYDTVKRYLRSRFNVGDEVYRRRWGLPPA